MKKLLASLLALAIFAGFDAVFAASLTIRKYSDLPPDVQPIINLGDKEVLVRAYEIQAKDLYPGEYVAINKISYTGGIGEKYDAMALFSAFGNFHIYTRQGDETDNNPAGVEFDPVHEFVFQFFAEKRLYDNEIMLVFLYVDVLESIEPNILDAINNDEDGVITSIAIWSNGRIIHGFGGDVQPVQIIVPPPTDPPIYVGPTLFIQNVTITSDMLPQDVRMTLWLVEGAVYGALVGFRGEHQGYQDSDGDGVRDPLTASVSFRYEPRQGMMAESGEKNDSFRIGAIDDSLVSDNLGTIIVEQVPEWAEITVIEWATLLYTESGGEQFMGGEATITVVPPAPPIVIHTNKDAIVMGDTVWVTIEGDEGPFQIQVPDELYTAVPGSSDREFLLVPVGNWMQNWPSHDTQGQIYFKVSGKYFTETSMVTVKARLGDVTGYLGITPLDASFILRYILELVEFLPYQEVVADFDQDGEVDLWDAINVLRRTVGLPLMAHTVVAPKSTVDVLLDAVSILDLVDLPQEDKDLFRQVLEREMREVAVVIPFQFALAQNFPNPFNASTTISYDVPADGVVKLAIYDTIGRQVAVLANEPHAAGSYQIVWNAAEVGSGMYFCAMEAQGFRSVQKMVLLK